MRGDGRPKLPFPGRAGMNAALDPAGTLNNGRVLQRES